MNLKIHILCKAGYEFYKIKCDSYSSHIISPHNIWTA